MRRRRLRLRSLSHKLALIFCAITALAMVAIWFYVVPQLQDSLYKQRRNDLARVARASSFPLQEAEGSDIRAKRLDELVRAVADSADARVTLYDIQFSHGRPSQLGAALSDSRTAPQVGDLTAAIALAAAKTRHVKTGYGRMDRQKVVQTAVPLVVQGRAWWVALYTRSLSGVDETVALIRRRLLIAGLAAGVLALLGGYLVATMLGRRVRRLERAAGRVAAGQFVEPLPVDSEDELGQLTEAFNDMQQRLARVDRARKEFVANASHELRTPLFSLGGFIELL